LEGGSVDQIHIPLKLELTIATQSTSKIVKYLYFKVGQHNFIKKLWRLFSLQCFSFCGEGSKNCNKIITLFNDPFPLVQTVITSHGTKDSRTRSRCSCHTVHTLPISLTTLVVCSKSEAPHYAIFFSLLSLHPAQVQILSAAPCS
jgi:hypothetical protein